MRKNRNITLMYVIVFLQGLVFYGAVSTVYRQAKGLSMTEIFVIESVSWILMILLEIPWGWFADRFGYKKTIIISNLVFFMSKIVFYKAAAFQMFMLERVLLSVALSGLSGCDIALLFRSKGTVENSEKIFARYRWFATGGLLVASLLSPLIINIKLEATALLTIIPYGIATAASLLLVDVKTEKENRPSFKTSFRFIIENKRFILFIIAAALLTEVVQSVTVFLNQLQYLRSGIGIQYFGILLALAQAVRLIGIKSHVLSGKFGKLGSIIGLSVVILLGCVGLIFAVSPIVSIVLICLIGGTVALADPMIIDIQNRTIKTNGDRATILSAYSMCGSMIAAGINPIIGIGADWTIQFGFLVSALVSLAACLLFLLYMWKISSSSTKNKI